MKQFIFDITEKTVKKNSVKLDLLIGEVKIRNEFTNFFNFYNNKMYLNLEGEDNIKITDKIIVSFDINEVNLEETFLDHLDKLLYQAKYLHDIVANNQKDRILSKIKYLADYHYSIESRNESRKAPVAE